MDRPADHLVARHTHIPASPAKLAINERAFIDAPTSNAISSQWIYWSPLVTIVMNRLFHFTTINFLGKGVCCRYSLLAQRYTFR